VLEAEFDLGRLQLADVDHDAVVYVRPALEAVAALRTRSATSFCRAR